jgi:hypothetical protein
VIAGAVGGVGSIAVQLARRAGATVLAIAGPSNDAWLAGHGAEPVNYGDNLPARLRAAATSGRIDAPLDFFGGGYVAMAMEDLKLSPDRVDTIADFEAVKRFGVQSKGGADAATAVVLAELAVFRYSPCAARLARFRSRETSGLLKDMRFGESTR